MLNNTYSKEEVEFLIKKEFNILNKRIIQLEECNNNLNTYIVKLEEFFNRKINKIKLDCENYKNNNDENNKNNNDKNNKDNNEENNENNNIDILFNNENNKNNENNENNIDMLLKPIPEHIKLNPYKGGLDDDPRWVFFRHQKGITQPIPSEGIYLNSDENNTNYYYRKNGDKLEHLGKFTKLYMPSNQHGSNVFKGYLIYTIFFDKQNIISDAGDKLYYTDKALI